MKKGSLVNKLIIVFSGILAVILIILAVVLSFWFRTYFENEQKEELNSQCVNISFVAKTYLDSSDNGDFKKLQETITYIANDCNYDIIVVDSNEFAYASSNNYLGDKVIDISLSDDDKDTLKKGNPLQNVKLEKINSARGAYIKPIIDGDDYRGAIIIFASDENIQSALTRVNEIIWISVLVAVILSAIVISYVAKKLIIEPINEINVAAEKLAKGDVDKKVVINSKDEIGELAQSFNMMAESLKKVDKNRREFISNVSHELRSPITSINGFISGILDGVIQKDKEDYYLKIVHDEISRLSRLVNDLLDISAMEAGKFKLSKSEMDINAVIKLCLANLEGKIAGKDLHVEVLLENKHQFVFADMDRIIQVVTNLLDNAVKYTDEGGFIKVNTKVKANKVYVSILNNGNKMSEEQIIRIWDRFYKSDKSRTNKESTGLGLPIVRLILTQHGEDIWVKNVKDGVEFTFTLTIV